MNFFNMAGKWGDFEARIYNFIVVPGLKRIYEAGLDEFVPRGNILPGMRLLDVGCGSGHLLELLGRRFPGIRLTGMDLSREMTARAKRALGALQGATVVRCDALRLPFVSGAFDLVVSMASIKHWPDRGKGVSEICRVLKPGGRFFIMEANPLSSRRAALNFVRLWRLTPWPVRFVALEYFRRFVISQGLTADSLKSLCIEAGLTEVRSEALEDFPAVVAHGCKAILP